MEVQPAAASSALAADFAVPDLLVYHLGAGPVDPVVPLAQRNLAWEHPQAAFQEQVAADSQNQPTHFLEKLEFENNYKTEDAMCKSHAPSQNTRAATQNVYCQKTHANLYIREKIHI